MDVGIDRYLRVKNGKDLIAVIFSLSLSLSVFFVFVDIVMEYNYYDERTRKKMLCDIKSFSFFICFFLFLLF